MSAASAGSAASPTSAASADSTARTDRGERSQFLRYAAVGLCTTALDLTLFSVFALAVGLPSLAANVLSTCLTLCVSFVINRWFVFRSDAGAGRTFVPFVTVTLFSGLVIQSLVIWAALATGRATTDLSLTVLAPAAKVAAMAVGMVSNYLGYRWLFGATASSEPPAAAASGSTAVGNTANIAELAYWRTRTTGVAAAAAVLAAASIFIVPGEGTARLTDATVAAVVVAAAFLLLCRVVLGFVRASLWRWAIPSGLVLAVLDCVGHAISVRDALPFAGMTAVRSALVVLQLLGATILFAAVLATVWEVVLRHRADRVVDGRGRAGTFLAALRQGRGHGPVLTILLVLVLARVPWLALWWPGVVPFDTFRSYAQVRGNSPWESYEPVGHTGMVWLYDALGNAVGAGDVGKVALAAVVQILAMAGAFTFVLVRMARWGVHRYVFWGSAAWLTLSPVFGMFSVTQVKDVPFAVAVVVFLVALGEVTVRQAPTGRWPWVVMALAGVAAIVLRSNGVHVIALTLLVLLVALRGMRRQVLAVLVVCLAGYGIYSGPVYSALGIESGRAVELFSAPIQQVARISRDDARALTDGDRKYLQDDFGMTPQQLGDSYDPGVSDPPKDAAFHKWDQHSTGEFLSGWSRLAGQHPSTAVQASLAGTAGYWYPSAPLRDGFYTWSRNDIRNVHLNIPSGPPKAGLRKDLQDASLLSTNPKTTRRGMTTNEGFAGPQFRALPVLGSALSPGFMTWLWITAAVGVALAGRRRRLAVTLPVAVLYLTLLAGPVSGSVRYSYVLFAALPLAVAMLAVPLTRAVPRSGADAAAADPVAGTNR